MSPMRTVRDKVLERVRESNLSREDKEWIEAMTWAAEEGNQPLTADDLLFKFGEPVYVRCGSGKEGWVIFLMDYGVPQLIGPSWGPDREPDMDYYGLYGNEESGAWGLHPKGWIAYRRQPKEGL